jgi:hypothetical protein
MVEVTETERRWTLTATIGSTRYTAEIVADKHDKTVLTGSGNDFVPAEFAFALANQVILAVEWLDEKEN